ncbi:hypothetical protein JCM1840_002643 [Sporobolomyces johnsonii]
MDSYWPPQHLHSGSAYGTVLQPSEHAYDPQWGCDGQLSNPGYQLPPSVPTPLADNYYAPPATAPFNPYHTPYDAPHRSSSSTSGSAVSSLSPLPSTSTPYSPFSCDPSLYPFASEAASYSPAAYQSLPASNLPHHIPPHPPFAQPLELSVPPPPVPLQPPRHWQKRRLGQYEGIDADLDQTSLLQGFAAPRLEQQRPRQYQHGQPEPRTASDSFYYAPPQPPTYDQQQPRPLHSTLPSPYPARPAHAQYPSQSQLPSRPQLPSPAHDNSFYPAPIPSIPPLVYSSIPLSKLASTSTAPLPPPLPSAPDHADPQLGPILALAASRRAQHRAGPSPLLTKPMRAKALDGGDGSQKKTSAAQCEERPWKINRNPQGQINSLELIARCACTPPPYPLPYSTRGLCRNRKLARLVLRSLPPLLLKALEALDAAARSFASASASSSSSSAASPTPSLASLTADSPSPGVALADGRCLSCAGLDPALAARLVSDIAPKAEPQQESTYEDTLSAAIDRLEALTEEGEGEGSKGEEWKSLMLVEESKVPAECRAEMLKCDVCDLVCGLGTVIPTYTPLPPPSSATANSPASTFTVEVVCARCDALFKCCSDCGGGGGRLTPGRWRSKELFPEGRKTCQLSHARNPALGELTTEVHAIAALPRAQLAAFETRCRQLYFNTRLGVLCRPEFLLKGDGLARSFAEAEKSTIDHWNCMAVLLREDLDPNSPIKRYLTMSYSKPRRRHPRKSSKTPDKPAKDGGEEQERVAFGFAITEADFSSGTLFFAVVIPWAINGQAFEATSLLTTETTRRIKSDLALLNAHRIRSNLAPYPRITYNYCISPFRLDSRPNQSMARRGLLTLDELEKIDPGFDRTLFPPFKAVFLPAKYARAMHVFVRRLEDEEDLGGPPADLAPRKRARRGARAASSSAA